MDGVLERVGVVERVAAGLLEVNGGGEIGGGTMPPVLTA